MHNQLWLKLRWHLFINTAVHIVNFTSLSELRESIYTILSISLQLNGTNPSFPYHINIIPEERNIAVTNVILIFGLRMQHDTLYNVSVMVCGESSSPLIGLYYRKSRRMIVGGTFCTCGDLVDLLIRLILQLLGSMYAI